MLSSAAIDHPTIAQRLQHRSSARSSSGTTPPSRQLVSPPAAPTSPPAAPSLRSFARTPRAATPCVKLGVMLFSTGSLTTHMKSWPLDSSAVTSSVTSPPLGSHQRELWQARPNLLALLKTTWKMPISWHTATVQPKKMSAITNKGFWSPVIRPRRRSAKGLERGGGMEEVDERVGEGFGVLSVGGETNSDLF